MEASRELDGKIASDVMGLRPCPFHVTGMYSAWATVWQCCCETTKDCYPENQSAILHPHSALPRYSENLEAAWDVLVGKRSFFLLARRISSQGGEDFRLCRDYPESETYWLEYMTPGGLRRGPDARTPALAICLAAIEATKRENKPEESTSNA